MLLLAGSCQPPKSEIIACDFEQPTCDISPASDLSTEQAHSGQHSIKTTQGQEFVGTFTTTLGKNLSFLPRHLRLSAWAFVPNGRCRTSILVLQLTRAATGELVSWSGLNVDQVVKRYGQWEHVYNVVDLPADLWPEDNLKFYVWRSDAAGTPIYLDDIRIEAWP